MSDNQNGKILSSAEFFVGRTAELDAILRYANAGAPAPARRLFFASAPALGASETLKQIFDRLFRQNGAIVPIYFALRPGDETAVGCARRFAREFVRQVTAFRRQNAEILDFAGDMDELVRFAAAPDAAWINLIAENLRRDIAAGEEKLLTRQALSAPLRAAAQGTKIFVMIDEIHEAEQFSGAANFIEELTDAFSRAGFPFVFAGRRRFSFGAAAAANLSVLQLEKLSFSDAGLLAASAAAELEIALNDQTRDLIAVQFDGNPLFIKNFLQSASEGGRDLTNFRRVEQLYTDEIFGGKICRFYDEIFNRIAASAEIQKNLIGLLYDALTLETDKIPIAVWRNRSGLGEAAFQRTLNRLNEHEIVRLTSNHIEAMRENEVLTDYVTARFRLEIIAGNRALTVGEMLSAFLKRAPQTMAKFYRRRSAVNLRELTAIFDCQEVPRALLDYSRFKAELKGAPDEVILTQMQADAEKIVLPQITFAAHTAAFYPQISQAIERERSAVALGFAGGKYTDEGETAWITAQIDSKLEAGREVAEFWCDRLEIVALMCNFTNYKIWLIAPEGFTAEASEALNLRGGIGSSRKQYDLLARHLGAEDVSGAHQRANEYEIIVPMGEDTELIAAQTVEEIAKRHHFAPKAINQIKTALVEACINAAEHSLSPDRKIYQKFAVEADRIVITVANRGLRLADRQAQETAPNEGRRGWGLNLMKTLMDDVKFEETDDGTRISMTKYLK